MQCCPSLFKVPTTQFHMIIIMIILDKGTYYVKRKNLDAMLCEASVESCLYVGRQVAR